MSKRDPHIYCGRDFCRAFFPKAHARQTCGCYRDERERVLIIQPRTGRPIRRV